MSHCVSQYVALGPEEGVGRRPAGRRGPPFDQLVEGGKRQGDAGRQKEEPAAVVQLRAAAQELAGQHRRDEALREMAQPVVVIAGEAEDLLDPKPDRHTGIRVVAAHHQHHGMQKEQAVEEGRERKPLVRRDEDRNAGEHGGDLQPPRVAIVRADAGPDQDRRREREEDEGLAPGDGVLLIRCNHVFRISACRRISPGAKKSR